jgi:hypothetical protein
VTRARDVASQGGLVLLNTTSFSAVTSASLPTGTFTTAYDNYHLSIKFTPSTGMTVTMRFRTSGTDNTSSTYKYIMKNFSSASADETYIARTGTSTELARDTGTLQYSYDGILRNPMLALQTHMNLTGSLQVGNFNLNATGFDNTTLFDSLTLLASTGNITGSITVYGYRK